MPLSEGALSGRGVMLPQRRPIGAATPRQVANGRRAGARVGEWLQKK
jgi:hypothetical protein